MTQARLKVDHFIRLDQQALWIYGSIFLGILILGGGAIIFALISGTGDPDFDRILKWSGPGMTLISGFPLNSFVSRWERMKTLQAINLDPTVFDTDSLRALIQKLYARSLGV